MEIVIYSTTEQKDFFFFLLLFFTAAGQKWTTSVFVLQTLFPFQTDKHNNYSVNTFSLFSWGVALPLCKLSSVIFQSVLSQ